MAEERDTKQSMESGVSRREFLGTVGSGSVSAVLAGFAVPAPPAEDTADGLLPVTLDVNGRTVAVRVEPRWTLLNVLREEMGLIGTKPGCERGECGACTVVIDGRTVYACSTLTHMVGDRNVRTIEGLEGPNGELHPIQQAFIDELGPQCGFCTPGQIMSTVALLEANPNPSRDEARHALSGNLCRCGAYDHYLNSVMRAAQEA